MKTSLIRAFIENRRQALTASGGTAQRLDELCHAASEFCVKALADTRTHVSQKAQLLAGLVRSPIERNQIVAQLHTLTDAELLHVLDGLRLRRLNGRRVRELGLASLVGHARFAELAANHRLRLVRIFKHLLGERTWSSVRRFLEIASPDGERFLQANVLRFAADADRAREALCFLAGLGIDRPEPARKPWLMVPWLQKAAQPQFSFADESLRQSVTARRDLTAGRGMSRETLSGIRGTYHRQVSVKVVRELAAPAARRACVDGPLTAALKEAFTSNEVRSLDALAAHATGEREQPTVDIQAAVVLDLSGSTVSSGERLYHPAALGLALVGLLKQHVRKLNVVQVGGSTILNGRGIPRPQGATDLATAVLEAARSEPEAILVITDGYENFRQGDVAQVVAGMRRLRLATTVQQVTPVVAAAEDLSRRRLSETIPLLPIEHEAGVGELAARLLLVGESDQLEANTLRAVEQLLFEC